VQPFLEHEAYSGGSGDELDRAVVVGRPEPARHDTELGRAERLGKRVRELFLSIADDRDPGRLDAVPE